MRMREITQTGRIPIEALGTILLNHLKFLKVFFVFYLLPVLSIGFMFYITNKEKIFAVISDFVKFAAAQKMAQGNTAILNSVQNSLQESLTSLISSPSFIVLFLISFVLMFVLGSCLLTGTKHTFYKKISIVDIAKEGIGKTIEFVWTILSMHIMIFLVVGVIVLFVTIPVMILGPVAMALLILPLIIGGAIVGSMFAFYIPIHFFADNGPISTMLMSCKTFWKNFFPILGINIVVGIVLFILMVIIGIPMYIFMYSVNPDLSGDVFIRIFQFIFLPYMAGYLSPLFMTFIAYPELLDEEGNTPINCENQEQEIVLTNGPEVKIEAPVENKPKEMPKIDL